MKLLLWIVFLCACFQSLSQPKGFKIGHGTTLITYLSKDSIVVAEDSKELFTDFKSDSGTTITKLRQKNNFVFGFSGAINIFDDSGLIYSVYNVMDSILSLNLPFDETYLSFDQVVKTEYLQQVLNTIIKEETLINRPLLSGVFITNTDHKIQCRFYLYVLKKSDDGGYYLEHNSDIDSVYLKPLPQSIQFGFYDHITAFLQTHRNYFLNGLSSDKNLCNLVNLEVEAHKKAVDFPIVTYTITPVSIKSKVYKKTCD